MALQDRTLANTMAKMGMEATRRRNTEAALQAMRQPRGAGDLPVRVQSGPMKGAAATLTAIPVLGLGTRVNPSVPGALQQAPAFETLTDSPETRQVMSRMVEAGVPDEARRRVLFTWATEGLEGVKRLVAQGLAPAFVLGLVGYNTVTGGAGQNGAPAGSGLPELGV